MMSSVSMRLFMCTVISMAAFNFLRCEAFLLADNCPTPAPCTCSGSGSSYAYIFCNSKNLNATPQFVRSGSHVSTLYVRLYSNHLITIPNNAFKNLSSINATAINIQLQGNKISSIGGYAFSGIENVTDYLNLENNNLSSIPVAIGNLRALKTMFLQNNPITSLGVSTQSEIGHTLQTLRIDLKEFSTWPAQFEFLRSLKSLTIRYINFTHLSSEAFQSFENSLTTLSIDYAASFNKIPNAVCQLSNLQSLTLNHFSNLNQNSTTTIFDHCTKRLSRVTYLDMQYNQLTKFPDVFHIFPSITTLDLRYNSIDIIETEKIPTNNVLSTISLDSNKFKRIPNALNRLKHLTTLSIRNNDISSVEDHDLSGLVSLRTLYLYNNPIKYISSHAFRNNKELTTLNLEYTYLRNVPAAVMSLPKLSSFGIRNTHEPIPCTCDMSYLKGWNASAVRTFDGQCAFSNIKIQNFIMSSLPQCP